jgi:hypothetical protein
MALQTPGLIRLGDIHVEAEGSIYAGTSISSLNDANIRGLTPAAGKTINATLGTMISFSDFYGASSIVILDTQTVTVGTIPANQYVGAQYGWTDFTGPDTGSVSDGTSNIYSGATVRTLLYFDLNANTKYFSYVNAGNSGNTGWTTLTVNGSSYQRSAATYTYSSSQNTSRWEWSTNSTNPMGTTNGATRTVEWT